jgi:NAD(P)-dependent dehydrogenase (short-subunit alcohol dehydrogenase family)
MKRLENKVALVTGGTSGIGYATAQEFLAQGAEVIITSRGKAGLDKALGSLGKGIHGIHGIISDASDMREIAKLPHAVKAISDRLDVLFLNASSDVITPFEMQSEDAYDHTFNANAKGVFFTIQNLLPLIPAGGSIILNGTITVNTAMPGISPLIAAKGAMAALGRSLAIELATKGIRVNSISPGAIKTPGAIKKAAMFMGVDKLAPEQFEEFAKNITQGVPMKRLGESTEIAKAALFLASDESSYITGADLVVDGGKSIAW